MAEQTAAVDMAKYPMLGEYSALMLAPSRDVVGREREIKQLRAAMERPELCNALLLGPAGTGKTTLVQALSDVNPERHYREINLAGMIAGLISTEELGSKLKRLFDEAEQYVVLEGIELVLFIDEIHQIVQLSPAAVEALKPILAASGTRGIRVIAATTYDEFHQHMSRNLPLVERLQRINLDPPDRQTTIKILRGMAEHYGVSSEFYDDKIFHMIYDYTESYMPMSVQPRKSILILDAMVGWKKSENRVMDKHLVADVLEDTANVNVAFNVDAKDIKRQIDAKVFSQDFATSVVARRLQIAVADLHDRSRPMSSFLFTGSTGVGKTELTKQLAKIMFGDDQRHLIRFDMTEFSRESSVTLFQEELARQIWNLPYSVILFDEIEKAASNVSRLLLQVLDDGRISNQDGREVSFLNAYVVMTTNAASEIYKDIGNYMPDDDGSGAVMMKNMRVIRRSIKSAAGNRFPPELLGRIDDIVPFSPLSRSTQRTIVANKLWSLAKEVKAKHGVAMQLDERVLDFLVEDKGETDSDAGGAREAIRRMTNEVTSQVAAFVNAYPTERSIRVDIVGELTYESKERLESDAYVSVTAAD